MTGSVADAAPRTPSPAPSIIAGPEGATRTPGTPRTPLTREQAASSSARLHRLPASARSVFETLERSGPLTHRDLLRETGMPGRTVRYAVRRLKDAGVIGARCNLMDCRQCYFFVVGDCPGEGRSPFVKTGWRAL